MLTVEELGDRAVQERVDDPRVGVAADRRDPVAGQLQRLLAPGAVRAGRVLGAARDVQAGERAEMRDAQAGGVKGVL